MAQEAAAAGGRANRTAFFDDVLAGTGVEEGPAMRAVWYLAWCGEVTCDTFECVRYANFQASSPHAMT